MPKPKTPAERSAYARIAAFSRWAQEDAREGTAKARDQFLQRFERAVDPDNTLEPAERQRRAECARKAYFAKLALKSARARAKGSAS